MKRVGLAIAVFLSLSTQLRAEDDKARDAVWLMLSELGSGKWAEARKYFTETATVTGVPAEEPAKRWTKSIADYIGAKPRTCANILDSKLLLHDASARLLVDYRHEHLIVRSTFDLVKLKGEWKIDGWRFSTRGDAQGAAAEMEKLKGTWRYVAGEKEASLFREVKLKLGRDEFEFDIVAMQLNLFGSGPATTMEFKYRGWRVRVDPSTSPKSIDFASDEPKDPIFEAIRGIYRLDGDQLTLRVSFDPQDRPTDFQSTDGLLILKRQ